MVPSFSDLLSTCAGHRRVLLNLVQMVIASTCLHIIVPDSFTCELQNSANCARSDDIAKTNACIMDYLQPLTPKFLTSDRVEFLLPDKNHPEDRGWAHLEYGALLYPQLLIDSFNITDYM